MEVAVNQWNEAENEVEEVGLQRRRNLKRSSSSSSSGKKIEVKGQAEQVVSPETESTPLLTSKKLEILKSVVYGGLTESIASLGVVTSAATADASTLNIVALSIANLFAGLFAFVHNLWELKADQLKRVENNTEAPVDRYKELLGQRENFFLHAFIAILSFIVFGLVPPVVYGFSFRHSNDKNFKLAAVAGASIPCITLLSIAKAYIKGPNSYLTYFQTVILYVSTGVQALRSKLLDHKKGQVAPRNKHFWSDWAVICDASEASIPKQPETGSTKQSDGRVRVPVSQDLKLKQPKIDFPNKKQPELVEVKVDEVYPDGGIEINESDTKEKHEVTRTEVNAEMILQHEDIENSTILPASDPPLPVDSTSVSNVTNESEAVSIMKGNDQERQELYLENVYQKPPTQGFYCSNCQACIQKGEWEQTNVNPHTLQQTDVLRCSSCFSFLIPIGSWLSLVTDEDGNDRGKSRQSEGPEQTLKGASQHQTQKPDQSEEVNQSVDKGTSKSGKQTQQIVEKEVLPGPGPQKVANEVKEKINGTGLGSILIDTPGNNMKSEDSSNHLNTTSQDKLLDQKKVQVAPRKKQFWSDSAVIRGASEAPIPKQPETVSSKRTDWRVIAPVSQDPIPKQPENDFPDKKQPELEEIEVHVASPGQAEQVAPSETERTPLLTSREQPVPVSSKKLEILKSIVYGGLTESLASLSVVTSAASADASTLNIIALSIANLIVGLLALVHNLWELKADRPKRSEDNAYAPVDRYKELLGQRENFFLHAFIAILSFIVFGLVPPVAYVFSFRHSDDKNFKLVAVAGASILCIALLSIAKAYIKRPNSYLTYFQIVLLYVSIGFVASVLSYFAGALAKKLLERVGWFESASNFAMQIPSISAQQPGWGSY